MSQLSLRAQFLVEHLDLERASGVEGARWEHFQLAHLCDESAFRIEVKSRQIAWSWLVAAEAVSEALLEDRSSIFSSINQDEAKEKIRYARAVFGALQGVRLPRLVRDNDLSLEFEGGARLLSLPATPPRGKARFNVYLDEFAHVARDREIYTAALPIVSKGGRLRIGSSPLGASGTFWEVFGEQLRRYPGYARKRTPWWEVAAFSKNVQQAQRLAPAMPTAARVELFGNDRLKALYANLPEEDFRQEYECEFVDETTAWISWEEIRGIQAPDLECGLAECEAGSVQAGLEAIEVVLGLIQQGKVEPVLAGGMDIGRTRNASELYFVGLSTVGSFPLRLAITMDALPFDEQLAVAVRALELLPVVTLLIDRNGIGRQLAETLEQAFPGKAQGVDFTNPAKALWASNAKVLVQQRRTPIPVDRELAYQIHSIKRTVTAAKNLVFDTARNEKHHADKFWAWALALTAAHTLLEPPEETVFMAERVTIGPRI